MSISIINSPRFGFFDRTGLSEPAALLVAVRVFGTERDRMARRGTATIISGDTHNSLEAEIGEALRAAILKGDFTPGARLLELELASRLNVSQGTIRAALKYLQSEGLVEYRPRRGNFVIQIDKADIHEISVLRDALESLGARLAAKRITASGRKALEDILQMMRSAAKSRNRKKLMELDFEFHRTVIEISGHRRLMDIYKKLEGQTRLFMRMTDQFHQNPFDIVSLHEPLAAAIGDGNADLAFQLASRHANADAEDLIEQMR
jgi:DNA-binding GntR family transcriptional regulator